MKTGLILHSFIFSFANILIILSRRYQVHQNIFCPLVSSHLTSPPVCRGSEISCCVARLGLPTFRINQNISSSAAGKGAGAVLMRVARCWDEPGEDWNTCNYCLSLLAAQYISSQLIKIITIIAGGAGTTSHLASELMTLYSWPNRKPQQCCSLVSWPVVGTTMYDPPPPSPPWQISISL